MVKSIVLRAEVAFRDSLLKEIEFIHDPSIYLGFKKPKRYFLDTENGFPIKVRVSTVHR